MTILVGFDMHKSSMSGSMSKMNQLVWLLDQMEGWVSEEQKEKEK